MMPSLMRSTSATSTKISGVVGQARVEEAVAAAVAVEPVLDVGPALDVVHRLVLDQLLDQRGRRVPADAAQVQEGDVEPGGEQVFELGIERQQALVGLEVRQQLGAQVDQEAHALADRWRSAAAGARAARPSARRRCTSAWRLVGRAQRGLVAGRARLLTFCTVGREASRSSAARRRAARRASRPAYHCTTAWARRPASTSLTRGSITACSSASVRRSARGASASPLRRSVASQPLGAVGRGPALVVAACALAASAFVPARRSEPGAAAKRCA